MDEVIRRGGEPATSSGPWGTFAKLVEGGAAAFGDKAALRALEEGEDHGRDDYRRDLADLDASARQFVETQVNAGAGAHSQCDKPAEKEPILGDRATSQGDGPRPKRRAREKSRGALLRRPVSGGHQKATRGPGHVGSRALRFRRCGVLPFADRRTGHA